MTRGIEDMLGLPHLEDILKETQPVDDEETDGDLVLEDPEVEHALMKADSMPSDVVELPEIESIDVEDHSKSMDDIYNDTYKYANELMDLGFNVDQRSAATIFEKANMLYKTALDAKDSKIKAQDMKHKAQLSLQKLLQEERRLQLEEMKIRHDMGEGTTTVQSEAVVIEDRNELIRRIRDQVKQEKES